ncbi:MAG: Gfo/Idh/MocA family oxidoreductase [Bacteroidales bacterium]|jgi:predicted dehydrogenase|nr:Gfo/Idh/MocA family oxidoreductase [Bacteroidales bacterium]
MKIGLIGCGHLGIIHAKCIQEVSQLDLKGVFDISQQKARKTARLFNTTHYNNLQELIDECDAIDIVATTTAHYELAKQVIEAQKHCFIEKPIAATVDEAEKLIELAAHYNVTVQIGHVERYNPAFVAALPYVSNPYYIEVQRFGKFSPRGSDVSVVHDIMIHDIDLVLSIINSEIIDIQTIGYKLVTDNWDYVNARLFFADNTMAHLAASRVASDTLRKMCIYQPNNCISVNFHEKKAEYVEFERKKTVIHEIPVVEHNAIVAELEDFVHAIQQDKTPKVSMNDGYYALVVADKVIAKLLQ